MPIKGQFPAVIQLSSLNGANGFEVDGVAVGDQSGYSANCAGDINGDGFDDIIIGAPFASPSGGLTGAGKSYVIFGKSNCSTPILLSNLNGINGFELDGTPVSAQIGSSVSGLGDVNGDGFDDIIMGGPTPIVYSGLYAVAISYIVFGKPTWSSPLSLYYLNINGMATELSGVNESDNTISVSWAGDINEDGFNDIIIGNIIEDFYSGSGNNFLNARKIYIIFGKSTWSNSLALSRLNGTEGIIINGEIFNGFSGCSVSGLGDINRDGINDIIIGAPGNTTQPGKSYVVFGKNVPWVSPFLLSTLNASNGFTLDGSTASYWGGSYVNSAGDINDDGINDIAITSYSKIHVIFGKSNWDSNFSLDSLNGTNGFGLDIPSPYASRIPNTAQTVGNAKDINGDGINDLIIGNSMQGKSYVLFGNANWTNPFSLSNLNGINGFVLNGVALNETSGFSVASAGDINGDGLSDMIVGAISASPNGVDSAGKTYIVFGDSPPVLVNNSLIVSRGGSCILTSSDLAAFDLNHSNNSLIFISTNIVAGQFTFVNGSSPLVSFTQQQIRSGNIQFIHDGSITIPSYAITVKTSGFAYVGPVMANITFYSSSPSAAPTKSSSLNPTFPPSTTPTFSSSFSPTRMSVMPSLVPSQLATQIPSYSPIAASNLPTFLPTLTPSKFPSELPTLFSSFSPTVLSLSPSNSPTTLSRSAPQLLINYLQLYNGETVTLQSANLLATEPGFNDSQLLFSMSDVEQGHFYRMPANVTVLNFPQSYIENGYIQFRHLGNQKSPRYSVVVSDGVVSTQPHPATIIFQGAPSMTQLYPLNTTEGQIVNLDSQFLNITTSDGSNSSQIWLQVENLQHASLTSIRTFMEVQNFTLAELQASTLQLQQDGSNNAPSLTLIATGQNGLSSAPYSINIVFEYQGVLAPRLLSNFLRISEGQTVTLTPISLVAIDGNGQPVSNTARFFINNLQHGHFSLENNPSLSVTSFTQSFLQQNKVQFSHDASIYLPSYDIAVSDAGLVSASLPAQIFFTPIPQPPQLIGSLASQIVTAGQAFSFTIQDSFIDPQGDPIVLSAQYQNSSQLPAWLNFDVVNERFSGKAPSPGVTDITVIATDSEGLSNRATLVINALSAPSTKAVYLEKTLISAGVSAAASLSFFLIKQGMKRASDKKLLESLRQNPEAFEQNVVTPIAKVVAHAIGFIGFTQRAIEEFKGVIRSLLNEIDSRGVDIHIDKMDDEKRTKFISNIAFHVKQYLSSRRGYCKAFCSFFIGVSADEIRLGVQNIADQFAKDFRLQSSISEIALVPLSADPPKAEMTKDDGLNLILKK